MKTKQEDLREIEIKISETYQEKVQLKEDFDTLHK